MTIDQTPPGGHRLPGPGTRPARPRARTSSRLASWGPRERPRTWRALVILAAALALCAPALVEPTRRVLGSPRTDTIKHLWTLLLGRQMLRQDQALWGHTDFANFPEGLPFYVIEPLGGLLAALLPIPSIPLVANLLSVGNLLLLGLAAAALGDRLARGWLPGLVAALLAMGASTTAFFFHLGVGELQHLFLLPFTLLLLTRLVDEGRWGDSALLGLGLGLTVSCGFYLGVVAAMGVSALALVALLLEPHRLRLASRLLPVIPLSLAIAAPFILGFVEAWPGHRPLPETGLSGLELYVPQVEDPSARLDLARLFWPVADTFGAPAPDYIGGQYLGPLLVGLALVGLWRHPRRGAPLVAAALLGLVMAIGTRPVFMGHELDLGGAGPVVFPYAWMHFLLNIVGASPHYPSRFLVLTVMALAGLGALAVTGLRRPSTQAAAVGLALLAAVDVGLRERSGWPWEVAEMPPVGALPTLSQQEDGAVVDLGIYLNQDHDGRARGARYQLAHGLPTQAIPISQLDFHHRDGAARVLALPLVQDLRALEATHQDHLPAGDYATDFALLREDGLAWLMLYGGAMKEGARAGVPPPT